jgi:prevent-host-death family protein
MNVPIREFKAQLSRYLRAAAAGKDVVVTSRGQPVAKIVPLGRPASRELSREELVERIKEFMPAVRIGNGKAPRGSSNPIKVRAGEKTMAEIISEGRGPR